MISAVSTTERPPIVAILGHVDHGKSTLLDYIRKTNTTAREAGGITQHVAAYEVAHTLQGGAVKRITFIDTPGHEAFGAIRSRSARMADIAILIVSAEDGVKAQTLEALSVIRDSEVPYVVAINKVDSPKAHIEKTISDLAEHGVYLEGRGGRVPYASVSAKTGQGVPELLELVLLVAELEELTADEAIPAEGFVVEAHRDARKGITATLIITNGTLRIGSCIAAGNAYTPVRSIEDTGGVKRESASCATPVALSGWSAIPRVGERFKTFEKKKDAEHYCAGEHSAQPPQDVVVEEDRRLIVPLILKADVAGSLDAMRHEIAQQAATHGDLMLKVIRADAGNISEDDVKAAGGDGTAIIVGFNVSAEEAARELAERRHVTIVTFDIIYKLSEWLDFELSRRTPKSTKKIVRGTALILKTFGKTKHKQVVGGRVLSGELQKSDKLVITRREEAIGEGRVAELQQQKTTVGTVTEGVEFGMLLSADVELVPHDNVEATFLREE